MLTNTQTDQLTDLVRFWYKSTNLTKFYLISSLRFWVTVCSLCHIHTDIILKMSFSESGRSITMEIHHNLEVELHRTLSMYCAYVRVKRLSGRFRGLIETLIVSLKYKESFIVIYFLFQNKIDVTWKPKLCLFTVRGELLNAISHAWPVVTIFTTQHQQNRGVIGKSSS